MHPFDFPVSPGRVRGPVLLGGKCWVTDVFSVVLELLTSPCEAQHLSASSRAHSLHLSMTLCRHQVSGCFASTAHVLTRFCVFLAILLWFEMLRAYLSLFSVPAQFRDWAGLHIT